MKTSMALIAAVFATVALTTEALAAKVIEEIEIEGMISPASPKALAAALEEQLAVKVVGFNFFATESGWPAVKVEYDSSAVTRDQIEKTINSTKDPTGSPFKVHKDIRKLHVALLDEEMKADSVFGEAQDVSKATSPVPRSPESEGRGQKLFDAYCVKCHGMNGGGTGAAAHGIATDPRQLWVWHDADSSADGYLFSFISNGRTDMPPWGIILSENERWDLVNYIKSLAPPKK
jgi:mono/diheme cytochrome c family protein